MRTIIILLIFGLSACSNQKKAQYDLIIQNVNLIDGTGASLKANVNVRVKDGRISSIDTFEVHQDELIIDGTDKFLIPGLFDCHVHTSNYKRDFPKFIHYGISSVFIPGGSTCTNDYFAEMSALGAQDSLPAPQVFHTSQHFTMEGRHPVKTYASSNWIEGETVFYLRDTLQIERLVNQVAKYPIAGIKLTIEDGPAPPFVERMPQVFIDKVNEAAQKQGLEVFVHVSDNKELSMALKAGIQNIIHFTGVDLDWERDKDLIDSIYQREISWVSTLMLDKSFLYQLNPEWLDVPEITKVYETDEINLRNEAELKKKAEGLIEFFKMEYGINDPNLENIIPPQVADIKMLMENGVNMVLGTDTGNDYIFPGYSLHEEMQLMELGGIEALEIIKMATHNAAKMLNVLDTQGSIEPGKQADLVLLNSNPLEAIKNTLSIHTVFKNGKKQKRIKTN